MEQIPDVYPATFIRAPRALRRMHHALMSSNYRTNRINLIEIHLLSLGRYQVTTNKTVLKSLEQYQQFLLWPVPLVPCAGIPYVLLKAK